MDESETSERGALLRAGLFGVIAVLIGADVLTDYGEGASLVHVGLELCILIAATLGAGLGVRRYREVRRQLSRLGADLSEVRGRAEQWRREHETLLRGLGAAIEAQFGDWGLSAAEAEIGMLLLKGLSLKEIAALRETSERTVREQARAVYRKAGLAGRAELSAFFLEDLLVARGDAAGALPAA